MRPAMAAMALLAAACQTTPSMQAPPGESGAGAPVTFNNQIVRIFQQRCQTCHRPGEVAPFSLLTYRDAHARKGDILEAVEARYMPPWKAVPGYGDFADVRRLSDQELELISRWVAAGAPEGDARDLPARRRFPAGWTLGTPGAVITMEEPFTVPPRSKDIYRCFTVPLRIPGDSTYIRASEVLPGNRKVVHHVQTFVDITGRSVELDRADPGPGYTCFGGAGFDAAGGLGGWAPGLPPLEIPPRVAWRVPLGARLVIQVHYHNPGDTAETDVTRVGLHFTSPPFDRRLFHQRALAWGFVIPAGAARVPIVARATITESIDATAVFAHMHLLGRQVSVTAHLPDGTRTALLRIDDWDFDWQLRYTYTRPVSLPAGTRIEAECVYDNSEGNPRNPNRPPRRVTSGFETTDEMCQANIFGTTALTRR